MSAIWGPFDDAIDAHKNLSGFTDDVLDPQFGIAWIGGGTLYTLRPPTYDANGEGACIVYECRPSPPPVAPPKGAGQKILAWFNSVMEQEGERQIAEGQRSLEAGRAINQGITTLYKRAFGSPDRKLDTAGVVMDGVGIGLSLVLVSFGPLEILGLIAMIGGAALLVSDGLAYGTELAGYDEAADQIKSATFYPRCVFALMTLPDAAWGLGKVVLESAELGTKAIKAGVAADRAADGLARTTAAAAAAPDALARSEQSSRAARYAKVGASAKKRADAARQKLATYMGAQAGSRVLIPPGLLLLLKEKDDGAEARARMAQKIRNYTFHVTAMHKS